MGVERVDYSSEEEYQQALQQEHYEYQQAEQQALEEKAMNDCCDDLQPLIGKYGKSMIEYCLDAWSENDNANAQKENSKKISNDSDDIPF
jgi:single-stranded DNA-binding protein